MKQFNIQIFINAININLEYYKDSDIDLKSSLKRSDLKIIDIRLTLTQKDITIRKFIKFLYWFNLRISNRCLLLTLDDFLI